jgi:hypothetical protein
MLRRLPMRAEERTLKQEPSVMKSSILMEEPNRAWLNTETADPSLAVERRLMELPM